MRIRLGHQLVAALTLLMVSVPRSASAQSTDDSSHADHPIAAWVSLGLGSGHVNASSNATLAVTARANVSVGSLLMEFRGGDVGPFLGSGDGVSDSAFLLGARTGGPRLFGSAALGYSRAFRYSSCMDCGTHNVGGGVRALAYEATLHANILVPGLAATFSGTIGPSRVAYSSLTLGLELGWFGR